MISIHTLRMEGDHDNALVIHTIAGFQSTPSAWRVTGRASPMLLPFGYISIHTLRMEGDFLPPRQSARSASISIHTLRMEGDWWAPSLTWMNAISIHTLRMEGDCVRAARLSDLVDFNPHPPHGG